MENMKLEQAKTAVLAADELLTSLIRMNKGASPFLHLIIIDENSKAAAIYQRLSAVVEAIESEV